MLILARKENESIVINDEIEVTVVNIKGDHVKIGIKAPKNIKVYRKEIYEEIQKANIEAANANPEHLKKFGKLLKKDKK